MGNHINAFQMTSKRNADPFPKRSMELHPRSLCAGLFLLDKAIKCFAFLFKFCFHVYFSRSNESRSIER